MSAIYQSREDLRTLFDVRNPAGVQGFHQWFAEKAGAEYGPDAG